MSRMKLKDDQTRPFFASRAACYADTWLHVGSCTIFIATIFVIGACIVLVSGARPPWVHLGGTAFACVGFGAFCWYRALGWMSLAYYKERDDCSAFMDMFKPPRELIIQKLCVLASKLKEACNAETVLYQKGIEMPQGCGDPEYALELAQAEHARKLAAAKEAIQFYKKKFWEVHRVVTEFDYYPEDSWKPYAGIQEPESED